MTITKLYNKIKKITNCELVDPNELDGNVVRAIYVEDAMAWIYKEEMNKYSIMLLGDSPFYMPKLKPTSVVDVIDSIVNKETNKNLYNE